MLDLPLPPSGLYGIYEADAVWPLIVDNAKLAKSLSKPVPGCVPAPAPALNLPDCAATRVNGRPGTGRVKPGLWGAAGACVNKMSY